MKTLRVLLVDDDPVFLDFAGRTLTEAKYSVSSVSDLEEAAAALEGFKGKAVVLSDLNVKKHPALEFLRESLKKYPYVPFTLLAHSPSLESVIQALKQGAYDFLRKPIAPDILRHSVARSVEKLNLTLEGEKQESEIRRLLARSRTELQKVKEISNFKGFLISATAHDFNSSLTVLDGYHQIIKKRCVECPEPQSLKLLDQAQHSVIRLRQMSATLLDYEAAERGNLRISTKEFELVELLKERISFYRVYAEQKQVVVDLEDQVSPLTVQGDPELVVQVLDNLLFNAVKFTPPNGEIRVGARPENGKIATIWVRDNGIGIPKKVQEKIFEIAGSGSDRDGSTQLGLGLVICRKLIEAQNGKIWLESTPGEGTVVSFSLPM
jgi:signal transduction histidine kinase